MRRTKAPFKKQTGEGSEDPSPAFETLDARTYQVLQVELLVSVCVQLTAT